MTGSAPVPVFGSLQLAAGFLALMGHRFGALTRNDPIGDELRACLHRYGLDDRFDEVAILNLSFDDIEDDETWNAAIDDVRDRFAGRSVQSVVNGCSAVDVRAHDGGVAVVDPTRLALQVIGLADGAGLLAASSALVNP
jgi:Asp/Glu/hydantoin racemase